MNFRRPENTDWIQKAIFDSFYVVFDSFGIACFLSVCLFVCLIYPFGAFFTFNSFSRVSIKVKFLTILRMSKLFLSCFDFE